MARSVLIDGQIDIFLLKSQPAEIKALTRPTVKVGEAAEG